MKIVQFMLAALLVIPQASMAQTIHLHSVIHRHRKFAQMSSVSAAEREWLAQITLHEILSHRYAKGKPLSRANRKRLERENTIESRKIQMIGHHLARQLEIESRNQQNSRAPLKQGFDGDRAMVIAPPKAVTSPV